MCVCVCVCVFLRNKVNSKEELNRFEFRVYLLLDQ